MKFVSFFLILFLMACSHAPRLRSPASASFPDGIESEKLSLSLEENFDGAALNRKLWNPHFVQIGEINNELQVYTPDSVIVEEGLLKLRAEKRKLPHADFTSGAVTTYGRFFQQYGYFEFSAKMVKGKGFWPAIWLLPEDLRWPPEIDIVEHLGENPNRAYFTFHWDLGNGKKTAKGDSCDEDDLTDDFNTYSLYWNKGIMIWYLNGVECYRHTENVPDDRMYILMNLAVGGSWPVPPDSSTIFPSDFEVDWMKVYSLQDQPQPAPVVHLAAAVENDQGRAGANLKVNVNYYLEAQEDELVVQTIVYDHTGKNQVAYGDKKVFDRAQGSHTQSVLVKIPEATPKGLYHVGVGLFSIKNNQWKNLKWLTNGATLWVKD
jgi:beta-glucanase (GH16 family)